MSAVAITISDDGQQVILASDGMTRQGGKIHSLNSSKILKVNDTIACLWMGVGKHPCGEAVAEEAQSADSVKEVAEIVAKTLKHFYDRPSTRHILDSHTFWVLIVGYDRTGFNAFRVWKEDPAGRYTPVRQDLPPGTIGCKTATREPQETDFQRLLATKYWPLYQPNLEYSVKVAFTAMVETYNKQGELCGGQLFIETLKPQ